MKFCNQFYVINNGYLLLVNNHKTLWNAIVLWVIGCELILFVWWLASVSVNDSFVLESPVWTHSFHVSLVSAIHIFLVYSCYYYLRKKNRPVATSTFFLASILWLKNVKSCLNSTTATDTLLLHLLCLSPPHPIWLDWAHFYKWESAKPSSVLMVLFFDTSPLHL